MDEESLAQEVLYLHSLWYIGPQNPNNNPNPNFPPNFTPHSNCAPNSTPYHYHYPNSSSNTQLSCPNTSSNSHLSYPNPNPPNFTSNCLLSYPNPSNSTSNHHLSYPINPNPTSNNHLSYPNIPNSTPNYHLSYSNNLNPTSNYHLPYPNNPNPTSNTHLPNPNPNPNPHYNPTSLSNSNQIPNKKQKTSSSEDKPWPVDPTSFPDQSSFDTWPPPLPSKPAPRPLSPNSASRSAMLSMQFPAIQSCKSYFTSLNSDSDSDSDSESFLDTLLDSFFEDLFANDVGLRVCYEKDHERGEFYCLVCESKRANGGRYKGCVALTQHACTVLKAGCVGAHRAYARAVCRVLGWDPARLPSIVLLPGSVVKINEFNKEITKETDSNPNPKSPSKEITNETNSNPNPNSPLKETTKQTESNPNPNSPSKETTSNPNPNSPSKGTTSNPNPNSPSKETTPNPNPNSEWPPCPTPFPNPNPPATWAATQAMAPPPPGVTAQSEALAKASKIQHRAIKSTKKFLSILEEEYSASDSEDSTVDFDSEEDEKPDVDKFFEDIFEKDLRLREYYKKSVDKGDFYCFVCQVRKDFKRKGMRYKSGLALVQHCSTVCKEGGKGAHRALARAVCRVFGWDPLCLPRPAKEDKDADGSKDTSSKEEETDDGSKDTAKEEKDVDSKDTAKEEKDVDSKDTAKEEKDDNDSKDTIEEGEIVKDEKDCAKSSDDLSNDVEEFLNSLLEEKDGLNISA